MEVLQHLFDVEPAYLSVMAVFLVQFAAIIWRISRAESNIYSRIANVENNGSLQREQIKQDILNLRLEIEREFLKKDSFRLVVDNIDNHLIRLEAKLDTAIGFNKQNG